VKGNKVIPKKSYVVSIGDLVADLVVELPMLPVQRGDCQIAREISIEPGGSANFLITAKRLGIDVIALGALGEDVWGSQVVSILESEGIRLHEVVIQGSTTIALVLVDQHAEHAFIGRFGQGDELDLDERGRELMVNAAAILSSGYSLRESRLSRLTLDAFQWARKAEVPTFFDPGPSFNDISPELKRSILNDVNTILLTEEEIPAVTSGTIVDIMGLGPSMVVVKRGAAGCSVYTEDGAEIIVEGLDVPVRDTTAAGDSFDAGYIVGFLREFSPADCARLANAVGAAKVQKLGSGRNVPTLDEVKEVLEKFELDIQI
jgi:sugar/nucleoside kinase (ribokinase family)